MARGCLKSRTKTKSLAFCRRKMLLKRPKRPAFGYRFALLTQIRDFLDSPLRKQLGVYQVNNLMIQSG
jgi:hypothetical protein